VGYNQLTYPHTAVGTLKPKWKTPTPRRPKWMKKMYVWTD